MLKILGSVALAGIICLGMGGCREKEKSAVDHFKETQGRTITPHGKIKTGNVKAVDGNHIQYETENGNVFRVKAEKDGEGYRYSATEKIK